MGKQKYVVMEKGGCGYSGGTMERQHRSTKMSIRERQQLFLCVFAGYVMDDGLMVEEDSALLFFFLVNRIVIC